MWGGGYKAYGHIGIVLKSAAASPVSSTSPLDVISQNPGPVRESTTHKSFVYDGYTEYLLGFLRRRSRLRSPLLPRLNRRARTTPDGRSKIEPNATTGVLGHAGPGNKYVSNKATGANQPL